MDTDRNRLIRYLTQTRNDLVSALEGLSEAQLDFKPAPERWSIAEIVEHIERQVHWQPDPETGGAKRAS